MSGSSVQISEGTPPDKLVIATRESQLALWQARHVQALLQALYPACRVELLGMTTRGDQILDKPLNEVGGKGLFTKELEVALQAGQADLAVHSLKDVPMLLPEGFELAGVMQREDPRDALVSDRFASLDALPAGARVGTSSLRRHAQLAARWPHLQLLPVRGNVNTRLAKLERGEFDALVLAAAGLKRLGFAQRIAQIIPPSQSLPAAGQGALGLEIYSAHPNVERLRGWLAPLIDQATWQQVSAERMVSLLLGGSCRVPLAAYAEPVTGAGNGASTLRLRALVASLDGKRVVQAQGESEVASLQEAQRLGERVAQDLKAHGAQAILAEVGAT